MCYRSSSLRIVAFFRSIRSIPVVPWNRFSFSSRRYLVSSALWFGFSCRRLWPGGCSSLSQLVAETAASEKSIVVVSSRDLRSARIFIVSFPRGHSHIQQVRACQISGGFDVGADVRLTDVEQEPKFDTQASQAFLIHLSQKYVK